MSSRQSAPGPDDDPSYELGDLELAPLPARPVAKPEGEAFDEELTTVLPALLTAPPSNDMGLELARGNQAHELRESDHDHGFGDPAFEGPALELDLPEAEKPSLRAEGSASSRAAEPATGMRASFPRGSLDSPLARAGTARFDASQPSETHSSDPPRSSRAPLSGSPEGDERAARALAGYGEPKSGLDAARYLLHVGLRMVALHRERHDIELRASELATRYDKALLDLGRALLDDQAVRSHEGLRDRVLLVLTKQGELTATEQASQAARAHEDQALEALAKKRAALESELLPFRSAEQHAESAHQAAEAELKRKKAKLQRAEIELRALTRASAPLPERVDAIEAERRVQQSELADQEAALAETSAALGRARRELSLRRGGLDDLEREEARKQSELRARDHGQREQVARAEHALSAALCALAEAADSVGLAHSAAEQVAGLRASESALDVVVDQLARYDRALRMYDREAVLRGAAIWVGLIGVVLLLIRLL
jgi:hypothetical protein